MHPMLDLPMFSGRSKGKLELPVRAHQTIPWRASS
jgi:hypothetical protein